MGAVSGGLAGAGPGGISGGGLLGGGLGGLLPTNLGQGIGAMTGTAGGAGGTGFAKPQMPGIQSPVTQGQVNAANTGVGNSLASQQALIEALKGNVGNLNNVYGQGQGLYQGLAGLNGTGVMGGAVGAQGGLNQGLAGLNGVGTMGAATAGQGSLAGQLGGAGGIGAQTDALAGLRSALAQQQGIANGTGPNPAQAMLNQSTGQNVANQAALMAGQRGAGANVGLMARQAAQQGAGIQQNAAGQAATMQANQQLNALNAMGQTSQAMAGVGQNLTAAQQQALSQLYGQGSGAAGMQQAGINAGFGQGQAMTGMQQAALGQNAGIAQQQIGNEMGAQNAGVQNNIANAGQTMGAQTAFNNAQVSGQGSVNAGNAGLAQTGMQGQQGLIGGVLKGAGAALAAAGGGMVQTFADGGAPAPVSSFGQFMRNYGQAVSAPETASLTSPQQLEEGAASATKGAFSRMGGPSAPPAGAMVGGDVADLGSIPMTAAGGGEADMRGGGPVAAGPGQRAVKPGDDYANDKIPAVLSEKEIVLPRSVTLSPNAPEAAAKFVAALQAKKGKGRKMMANAGDPELAPEAPVAPPVGAAPAMPEAAPAAPPQSAEAPPSNMVTVKGEALRVPRVIAPNGADLVGEAKAQAQDIANGVIKPMTYADVADRMAEKATLGKFGVIAGMLLSGAGAGLTHSDNSLLTMMDKEIQRDVEARSKTADNKRDIYRMGLEHQRAVVQNALTQSQIDQTDAERKGQELINGNTANALMLNAESMKDLGMKKNDILRMLAGNPAALQAFEQAWAMKVQPYFEQKSEERLLKAGAANQFLKAAHEGKGTPVQGAGVPAQGGKKGGLSAENPVDDKAIQALGDYYQRMNRPGMPSVPNRGANPADVDKMRNEAAEIKQLYKSIEQVNSQWEKLDRSVLAGKTQPGLKDSILAHLLPIVALYAGNNSVSEMKRIENLFPEEKDLPSVREGKAKALHEIFERAATMTGRTLRGYETRPGAPKLIADLPPAPRVAKGKEAAPEQRIAQPLEKGAREVGKAAASAITGDEKVITTKSGKKAVMRNGKLHYLKDDELKKAK